MDKRIKVYKEAKRQHPECWSGNTRDWSLPEYVALNPISEDDMVAYKKAHLTLGLPLRLKTLSAGAPCQWQIVY